MTRPPRTDDSDKAEAAGPAKDPAELARALLGAWAGNLVTSFDKLLGDLKGDARRIQRQSSVFSETIAARLTPLFQAARATPRAGRLVREAGLLFAAYRWHEKRAGAMTPEAARAEREGLDRRSAERIYQVCIELRGAVLKLGQFASTRRDLLPPAYVEALGRLQDSVPPVPFERIAERVQAELGAPIEELFSSFDPEPIAAASLAQVHGAVLPDGTRVAVKVQVPEVEAQVEGDLSLFSLMASAMRDFVPSLDLVPIAAELGRSVREELDYRLEAEWARTMAADLASDRSVLVPRIHEQLSSGRVLTMDRVDGERLTDFLDRCRDEDASASRRAGAGAAGRDAGASSGRDGDAGAGRDDGAGAANRDADASAASRAADAAAASRDDGAGAANRDADASAASRAADAAAASRDAVLTALVRTYAGQILGSGRFQADPHPGNFLVCPDGRLALLDFGAIHELSPEQRRAYAALTGAVIARDRARAAQLMAELGFSVREGSDPSALVEYAELMLDAFRPAPDRPLAEIDPRAAFDQALTLGRQSPIRIPHHFVQIGRVLAAVAGLVLAYRPRIELWPLVAPYLAGAGSTSSAR